MPVNQASAGTLVPGPCRLLTASLFSTAGTISTLQANGGTILEDNGVANSSPQFLTLPPNYTIPLGSTVAVTGSAPFAAISYAYP